MDKKYSLGHPKIHLGPSLALTFSGQSLGAVLGALSLVLIARAFTVIDFGIFSIVLVLIRTAPLLTALGLDTSMTSLASLYLRDNKTNEADRLIRTTFYLRLSISAILSLVLFGSADFLSLKVFHSPQLGSLLKIGSVGVFSTSLFNYFKSVLWTKQNFKKYSVLIVLTDALKLLAVASLLSLGLLSPLTAAVVYSLTSLLGAVAAYWHYRNILVLPDKVHAPFVRRLFTQSKWILASDAAKTVLSSFDLFIIACILGSRAAGRYGLASNLIYIFPILLSSLRAVLIPHVSRFSDTAQFKKYINKSLTYSLLLGAMMLPLFFFSKPAILFFFGARYSETPPVFNALLLVYMFTPLLTALNATFYALGRPNILALLDLTRLTLMITGATLLTPHMGLMGPPVVLFFLNASSIAFLLFRLSGLLEKQPVMETKTEFIEPVDG